jgi:hypothetical protein
VRPPTSLLCLCRRLEDLQTLLVDLSATDGEPLVDPTRYHRIVRSLFYIGVTRSNISYSTHILSQFVLPPISSTIVTRFVSYVVFMGLSCVVYHFHAQVLYNSRPTVMLPRLVICLIVDLFLCIMFFLVALLLLGRLRSRR